MKQYIKKLVITVLFLFIIFCSYSIFTTTHLSKVVNDAYDSSVFIHAADLNGTAHGSGTIIYDDITSTDRFIYILTAKHIVHNRLFFFANVLSNNEVVNLTEVYLFSESDTDDLAILKCQVNEKLPIHYKSNISSNLEIGKVISVYPYRLTWPVCGAGDLLKVRKSYIFNDEVIIINLHCCSGMSGSAVRNMNGDIIGVVSQLLGTKESESEYTVCVSNYRITKYLDRALWEPLKKYHIETMENLKKGK